MEASKLNSESNMNYGVPQMLNTLGVTKPSKGTAGKYGRFDAVIKGKKGNMRNLDAKITSKMNNYDAYHATKGKVNRELGKY